MTIPRRTFLWMLPAGLALAGCAGEPAPPSLAISATGAPGMNPGPDGADRPVTLTVLQLSSDAAFGAADILALQDPAAALGGDLIKEDRLAIAPGGSASLDVPLESGTTVIALIAGFRDPAGKTSRMTIPAPSGPTALAVQIGPSGLTTG